jgi:hypothetical protein
MYPDGISCNNQDKADKLILKEDEVIREQLAAM